MKNKETSLSGCHLPIAGGCAPPGLAPLAIPTPPEGLRPSRLRAAPSPTRGQAAWRDGSARVDLIPEDKSTGLTRAERWQNLMRELKPQAIDAVVGRQVAT